ncbi:MAG: hypothetical protein KGJ57_17620 [Sphingomonadales bacterium]|nr:hypothetical protein [Sphingomonadales bacterium]MDE2171218.1 hypothetical protein [Sphingomonadales bacterium]
MTFEVTCACGAIPVGPRGVCATCEDELRELLMPSSKDGALRQIAAIAEGSRTPGTLRKIARIARHGLTLKG